MSLVRSDDVDGELFAYSDQDHVWFTEKLAKAVSWFRTRSTDQPALFTRTELMDEGGTDWLLTAVRARANLPECAGAKHREDTMVFNRSPRLVLRATPADVSAVSHDWWTYQVVTGSEGAAHYDRRPSVEATRVQSSWREYWSAGAQAGQACEARGKGIRKAPEIGRPVCVELPFAQFT
ncbi:MULTISPECIES: hypothetical protein [unclassified Bradyrhizobium]|uniref:hypothetical protein n=1 Tax=unclassified Bradyrhizobium TaxID=2631580 RepID=UPI001FFA5D69|nr:MULTISPECIES: hypothetical protein [unclassified Bradyrhizobium]